MKMSIDWCPICGENLKDFEIETRLNHDKRHHPDYFSSKTGIYKEMIFFSKEDLK